MSTRLALGLLATCVGALPPAKARGIRVLDVGTGTGILAIAARKLGARHVVAIDIDADACAQARRNVRKNRVRNVRVRHADPAELHGVFDVVIANLSGALLCDRRAALKARLAPGGRLVVAGLLAPERDLVASAFAPLVVVGQRSRGEWAALAFG